MVDSLRLVLYGMAVLGGAMAAGTLARVDHWLARLLGLTWWAWVVVSVVLGSMRVWNVLTGVQPFWQSQALLVAAVMLALWPWIFVLWCRKSMAEDQDGIDG